MNTTLPLPTLVRIFAENAGLERIVAGEFVHAFFELVTKALAEDGTLTIKGLGRFDVVDDAENPVKFTPDAAMQKAVNTAFDAFDAIELDGDFDESALSLDGTESVPQPVVLPAVEEQPIQDPITETVETVKTVEVVEIVEDTHNELAEDGGDEPVEDGGDEPVEDHVDEPVEDEPVEDNGEEPTENDGDEPQLQDDEDEYYDKEAPVTRSRGVSVLGAVAMLLAGVIIGVAAGYLGRDKIGYLVKNVCEVKTDSIAADEPVADEVAALIEEQSDSIVNEETTAAVEQPVEEKPIAKPEPRYDVVTEKQFLTTLAGKYYGEKDYWVYIYEANSDHLKHPDRIKPGTRVLIPDLSDILTGDKAQDKKNACAKIAEIYGRYK